jgi:hypothetical protein
LTSVFGIAMLFFGVSLSKNVFALLSLLLLLCSQAAPVPLRSFALEAFDLRRGALK